MNFFSTYISLKNRNNTEAMKAIHLTLIFGLIAYIPVSFVGIYLFGDTIDKDLFNNIGSAQANLLSYLMRLAFLIVIAAHIPFIFFASKENVLVIIDELNNKTFSRFLETGFLPLTKNTT